MMAYMNEESYEGSSFLGFNTKMRFQGLGEEDSEKKSKGRPWETKVNVEFSYLEVKKVI